MKGKLFVEIFFSCYGKNMYLLWLMLLFFENIQFNHISTISDNLTSIFGRVDILSNYGKRRGTQISWSKKITPLNPFTKKLKQSIIFFNLYISDWKKKMWYFRRCILLSLTTSPKYQSSNRILKIKGQKTM